MEAVKSKVYVRTVAPQAVAAPRPAASAVTPRVQLRSEPRVSSRTDPAEREADETARRIMRMPAPVTPLGGRSLPHLMRFADAVRMIQRRDPAIARDAASPGGPATAPSGVATAIANNRGAGSPLPASVRGFMETRFGADFGGVRVHTGPTAARLSQRVNAQAFTFGSDVFFGRDRFRPDTFEGNELIAHELTHTIQQGAAPQARPPVRRSEDTAVTERTQPEVQRLGTGDLLDFFGRQANNIPGFRMLTVVLGVNPVNMSRVDRSAANILRAVVEFIPGGGLIVQALEAYGVFERTGRWIEQQLATLGISGASIREAIGRFLDSLGWRDIFSPDDVWNRARQILATPIARVVQLARSLGGEILRMIKDAILRPLAALASQTRAWNLLCAVLGRNPISGEAVPRTAETLIGGFMRLIGQEEIWQTILRANALGRAWAWFQGALGGLMGFARQIPQLFLQALQALEIADIVLLPRALARVASVFGNFIGNFVSWAGNTVWNLLEIVFEVVAPSVMVYLRRAAGAFRTILRDPIGFVRNLVRAGMQGFQQFAANFLTHLRASLIGWLTGAMSGANVYIPQGFTLREILKFVLSVLGLTWQNIRQKLVRVIGETAVRVLETGFDIVVALVTQGPAAAWEKIQETLSNLREMVIEQIMTFVRDRVVTAAVTRLLSMLSPAGAFIQAIIAIYNTVMFFVERLRQIAQVAASFIDSIAAIASGMIASAANRVEQTMAGLLTLVISFLARIAGLGRVTDAVTSVIDRVRQPIDRALDRVVDWIVATARRLGRLAAEGVQRVVQLRTRLEFTSDDGQRHTLYFEATEATAQLVLATTPVRVRAFLRKKQKEVGAPRSTLEAKHKTRILAAIREARELLDTIDRLTHRAKSDASAQTTQARQVDELVASLSRVLRSIAIDDGAVHVGGVMRGFLGAHPTGKGRFFQGHFGSVPEPYNNTVWDWNDGEPYPSGPVTRHPANEHLGYQNHGELSKIKPMSVKYWYIGGGTKGAREGDKAIWTRLLESKIARLKQQLLKKPDPTTEEEARAQKDAETRLLEWYKYEESYPDIVDMLDLRLDAKNKAGRKWQAHHVHEHSWGGDNAPYNYQYLPRPEQHDRLSAWWNKRYERIWQALFGSSR